MRAAAASYEIESVEMGAGDGLLQLVFSLGRSITKDDVEINRDGDAVILIRLNGAQVDRVWAELKDPLIRGLSSIHRPRSYPLACCGFG